MEWNVSGGDSVSGLLVAPLFYLDEGEYKVRESREYSVESTP